MHACPATVETVLAWLRRERARQQEAPSPDMIGSPEQIQKLREVLAAHSMHSDPDPTIAKALDILGYGPSVNLLHACEDIIRERNRLLRATRVPDIRLQLSAQLLTGMLANPSLTATSPGAQFLAQEAIDLAEFLCHHFQPVRMPPP